MPRAALFGSSCPQAGSATIPALRPCLPAAEWLIADRDYDADSFRDALKDTG
jgi:hypothetical protein